MGCRGLRTPSPCGPHGAAQLSTHGSPPGREKLSTCAAMGTNAVRGVTAVSPGKGQTPRGSTRFICCAHWLVRHQRGWKGTDLTGLVFVRSCQDGAQPAHVCIFQCDPLGTKARGTKYRKTTRPGSALPAQRNTRCPWPGRVSLQLIGTIRPGGLMETTPPLSPERYAGQIMSNFGNRLQKK